MTSEQIRLSIEAVPVVDWGQIEWLRRIRNATATSFSHDTTQISEQAQRTWWAANRYAVRAWLYYHAGTLVGFGLLREELDGRCWNSLAVLPRYQGKGFGSAITFDLLKQADDVVYASVKCDNVAAIAMHCALDWERIDGPDSSLVYFRSRNV